MARRPKSLTSSLTQRALPQTGGPDAVPHISQFSRKVRGSGAERGSPPHQATFTADRKAGSAHKDPGLETRTEGEEAGHLDLGQAISVDENQPSDGFGWSPLVRRSNGPTPTCWPAWSASATNGRNLPPRCQACPPPEFGEGGQATRVRAQSGLASRRHRPRGHLEELRARRKRSLDVREVQSPVHPGTDVALTGRRRAMQQVDEERLIGERRQRRVAVEGPHGVSPELGGAHEPDGHTGPVEGGKGMDPAGQSSRVGRAV